MWTNQKYPRRAFKGSYTKASGERTFELTDGKKTFSFESWQMAKELGWVRV